MKVNNHNCRVGIKLPPYIECQVDADINRLFKLDSIKMINDEQVTATIRINDNRYQWGWFIEDAPIDYDSDSQVIEYALKYKHSWLKL